MRVLPQQMLIASTASLVTDMEERCTYIHCGCDGCGQWIRVWIHDEFLEVEFSGGIDGRNSPLFPQWVSKLMRRATVESRLSFAWKLLRGKDVDNMWSFVLTPERKEALKDALG